jgi:hypothetical protein
VQVNVLATMLFALSVAAILLVLWQQRRAERMASVRPERETGITPLEASPSAGSPAA